MLGKILQKIQDNPTEAKFRKMNRVKVEPKLAGAAGLESDAFACGLSVDYVRLRLIDNSSLKRYPFYTIED